MMRADLPIGFFDSGVGGLSVYARFREVLPFEDTIYYGDLKNMPYGGKSKQELIKCAKNILDFYNTCNVKVVVIACNTSSAIAYEEIKDNYDYKIYPIIQSCAEVIAKSGVKRIGVFATVATINSGAYARELMKYNPDIEVAQIACPNWTEIVEHGLINDENSKIDIESKMLEIMKFNPEKIILGCTHYPYLMSVLKNLVDESMFIDPAKIFVEYIKNDLGNKGCFNSKGGSEQFYVSANPDAFVKNAKLFYDVKTLPQIV